MWIQEIFDIILMSLILGFIFKDMFRRIKHPGAFYGHQGFDWDGFKFAIMVTAPAVILHELGHKLVAIAFGFSATFHAAYGWLLFGAVLKIVNAGFIFFVPAYVSITGSGAPWMFSIVAFAGPFMNLVLWLGAKYMLTNDKVDKKYLPFLFLTKQINMFLFIFNMLPVPGFDGFKIYSGILQSIF